LSQVAWGRAEAWRCAVVVRVARREKRRAGGAKPRRDLPSRSELRLDRNIVCMTGGSPGRRAMNMNAQQLVIWAVIGIIAGWLASVVVGGGGGLLRYLITGLIGAFVGGFVFNAAGWKLNLGNEWVDQVVVAAIGAIIIVILARLIA
jgi:uncharacterized membrane protein YeaQ/YmgE (transglycosylase-associated protein family)